jgi:hypothetical protein
MSLFGIILHTFILLACISPLIFLLGRELYNHFYNKAAHKKYLTYSYKINEINKKILKNLAPHDNEKMLKIIMCDSSHQLFSGEPDLQYHNFYNYNRRIGKLEKHLEWCEKEFPQYFKAEKRAKSLNSILN